MTQQELVKLSDAARKLGCHVETLRERVRAGQLPAVRGPHGAYLITAEALRSQPRRSRGRPPKPWRYGKDDDERRWVEVERIVRAESSDVRIELRLLAALRDNPEFAPELQRLVAVHGLTAIGWPAAEIADDLEISERHVRRLAKKRLWRTLRYLLAIRRTRLDRRLAHERAQELIEILRERLNAEGAPRGPWRWQRHKLNAYERQGLLHAGLTEAELDAIWIKGLTRDQVEYLLLKGFRRSSGQRVATRTKHDPLEVPGRLDLMLKDRR